MDIEQIYNLLDKARIALTDYPDHKEVKKTTYLVSEAIYHLLKIPTTVHK